MDRAQLVRQKNKEKATGQGIGIETRRT